MALTQFRLWHPGRLILQQMVLSIIEPGKKTAPASIRLSRLCQCQLPYDLNSVSWIKHATSRCNTSSLALPCTVSGLFPLVTGSYLSIFLSIHLPTAYISLLCRHPRYLRTCALMYAIFKSDLNTPHVELLDSRATTQQNGSRCQHSQCCTPSNANVPLILLTHSHSMEERSKSQRKPGATTTWYPLRPAENQFKKQVLVKLSSSLWH